MKRAKHIRLTERQFRAQKRRQLDRAMVLNALARAYKGTK